MPRRPQKRARGPSTPFGSRAYTVTIQAPTGGWNARDSLSEMKPTDAVYLDNFIPDALGVRQRRGVREHCDGISGNFVESLMEYNVAGASPKMFAAGPNTIYDVTSSGTASSSVTGLTNGRWQHTMFATTGGNFLVIANGADSVRYFDGSSWTVPSITGVTSSSLISVTAHMSRLWFVRDATLKVYYLDILSVAGAATEIDFSPLCKHGGQMAAMATWTRDGGSGLDDYAVFATTKGEILVYQGTNPAVLGSWGLVGVFKAPEPIGRRCFVKLGADLCYLSVQGVLPLPQFLAATSAGLKNLAVTDKIRAAFQNAYMTGGTNFGWQVIEYPRENLLIINVPLRERAEQHQYVMNLQTGAWCRFKGINANCFNVRGDLLFCGMNDGTVARYGAAGVYDDNSEAVNALCVQAFTNFGFEQDKKFLAARTLFTGPTGYAPQMRMLTDFNISLPTFSPEAFEEIGPGWDEEDWDVPEWGDGSVVGNRWQPIKGIGAVGALAIATALTSPFDWNQTTIQFEVGRAR